MPTRVFIAGASGVIGRRLTLLLRDAGHEVFGTTRSPDKVALLRSLGAQPVVVDVFDADGLSRTVAAAHPEIVIHQLTDLPPGLDAARMADALPRNARVRRVGTRNLVAAALAAGARRLIAQSLAWVYAPGREPHVEEDPLDIEARGSGYGAATVEAVATLERLTLSSAPLEGVVLRYGQLYGPGTRSTPERAFPPLHVDAAAWAALLSMEKAHPGIYNIAEDNRYVSADKARRELGWRASFRRTTEAGS